MTQPPSFHHTSAGGANFTKVTPPPAPSLMPKGQKVVQIPGPQLHQYIPGHLAAPLYHTPGGGINLEHSQPPGNVHPPFGGANITSRPQRHKPGSI